MNRPTRQLTHLDKKLAEKASRRGDKRKAGKKEKRWTNSAAKYRPLVEGSASSEG